MKGNAESGAKARGLETIDVAAVRTPFGTFAVAATHRGVAAIFPVPAGRRLTRDRAAREPALVRRIRSGVRLEIHERPASFPHSLARAAAALRAYASGRAGTPPLAVDLDGTPFQRAVWERLLAIPHGKTTSYGEIAASLGRPKAARAVGAAVGANPVAILVPCHRVIGRNGSLTGFAFGLPMKRSLLAHERRRVK